MTHTLELAAPLSGQTLAINQVPDPVFAGMMMGDGLAIDPSSNVLLAPCAGVITQIAKTRHALTLTADNGAEILMHIGMDTVRLKGEGFISKVNQGQRVEAGTPLIEADFKRIIGKVTSLITAIVIANGDDYMPIFRTSGGLQAGETRFMSIAPRQQNARAADPTPSELTLRGNAIIGHGDGLHARPAALVQNSAKNFRAQVTVHFNGQDANARSVVSLLSLGANAGDTVEVRASGDDAKAALTAVIDALQKHSASAHAPTRQATQSLVSSPDGKIRGVSAAPGHAIGQVVQFAAPEPKVNERAGNLRDEFQTLARALAKVRGEIARQRHSALQRGDQTLRSIFDAHLALLDDPELIGKAERGVGRGLSAGAAFRDSSRSQRETLARMANPLLAERASDLKDLESRVLLAISGEHAAAPEIPARSILVADDLTPSEFAALPADALAGVVLARGGATSHVAILVRARGIPAIVAAGEEALRLQTGQSVFLDASAGVLDPNPDAETLATAQRQVSARQELLERVLRDAWQPALTLDGRLIEVAANIADESDAHEAVRRGADGVGLLRSEFLFIDRASAPTRAEQQTAYQAVLNALEGRTAIMRTLDVGGDKQVPYLTLPPEQNPALGLRGVRSGFARSTLLDDQLAALLSVSPRSRLKILLPMVADVADLLRVKRRLSELAAELGVTDLPELGVMIEVPSAAMLADQLAEHADFLSIGTNDLTQYALARDRCNPVLAAGLDPLHPALLRLIAQTTAGAAKHGRWVGVCGAMASDLDATPVLLGLGVTELSVSAGLVPELKSRVRALDLGQCRRDAQPLLNLVSADAVRARAREIWPQKT